MAHGSSELSKWDDVVRRVGEVADIGLTARQFGAFTRRGKVATPVALLRLALLYGPGGLSLHGPGGLSLRGTAAMAEAIGMSLTDKAVEGRLRKCGAWLEHLLAQLLAARAAAVSVAQARSVDPASGWVSVIDGSVIKPPGRGGQWRLHARYDPGLGRFVDLCLTPVSGSERVLHTPPGDGQTVIMDRGYARVRDFAAVLAAGCDFVSRIGWRSLSLQHPDGTPFDIIAALPEGMQASEHVVRVASLAQPLRLVLRRLPADKVDRAARRALRKSARNGTRVDPRTLRAAGYIMVITSLAAEACPAERLLQMYRARWQVELGFKRLKSLGGIDRLPCADPHLAKTWLMAHLIAAVLIEDLAAEILAFPPSKERRPNHPGEIAVTLEGLADQPCLPAPRHPTGPRARQ